MVTAEDSIFGEMEQLGTLPQTQGRGASGSRVDPLRQRPRRRFTFRRLLWRICWISVVFFLAFSCLQVLALKVFFPPFTPLMVQRYHEQKKDPDRVVHYERDYVRLRKISPEMVKAVIASEDGRFMYHKGFDVRQLKISYKENRQGKRVRGGSTISMQTAKNAFLSHRRSYIRKAREAIFTMAIEKVWGKRRIMEMYLNIIEFGDGIYGVEAASQHYFGHSAATLTQHEAALLAVILPSPLKRDPTHPTRFMNKQTAVIEQRMRRMGNVDLNVVPANRTAEDDEGILDFLRWVRQQKRDERKHKSK